MQNPWLDNSLFSIPEKYSVKDQYAMKGDLERIRAFNDCEKNKNKKIVLTVLPEPYSGSLQAPYILLLLNPGYSKINDQKFYSNRLAYNLWKENLKQTIKDAPFYQLIDELIRLKGGPSWWRKSFNKLNKDGIDFNIIAQSFLSLEFFPYHSKSFNHFPVTLKSQEFIFELLRQRIKNPVQNQKIILMRGKRYWETAVPELLGYKHYIKSASVRRSFITPKSIGEQDYNQILNELKKQK